jgi:DNA-binding NtrC family response regulator
MRDQLERLVGDMLDKGVHYEDARREFERLFIARALQRTKGNLCDAADLLGLHRNTIARKIAEYHLKKAWRQGPGA